MSFPKDLQVIQKVEKTNCNTLSWKIYFRKKMFWSSLKRKPRENYFVNKKLKSNFKLNKKRKFKFCENKKKIWIVYDSISFYRIWNKRCFIILSFLFKYSQKNLFPLLIIHFEISETALKANSCSSSSIFLEINSWVWINLFWIEFLSNTGLEYAFSSIVV